jgi:acetyl-CoA acyltransferase
MAAGAMRMNAGDVFICAGVESMTRVPIMGFNPLPHPGLYESHPEAYMSMGETAENVAGKYQISRRQQDEFALASHTKAAAAQAGGKLSDEIVPIVHNGATVDRDGCIRPDTTLDALADLKPAFDAKGTVTAGTSSPLSDGASAILVCGEEYAEKHGIGPVAATKKALQRAGLGAADIDIVELNEAFASQSLACIRDLGLDADTVNVDGGAIALGHPLGATGARITGKAAALLKREGGTYALATQCIGGGQGIATILEAV